MNGKEFFTCKSAVYSSARPDYAKAFVDYLFSDEIGLRPSGAVADIGSGTGIFSKMLLDRGCQVWGVEHSAQMRVEAEKLLGAYKNFISVDGSAESSGLEPGCADMITAASAFHWFDTRLFKKECLRIIKPGGKVVLCWNTRTEMSPFDIENAQVCRKFCKAFIRFNRGCTDALPKAETFFDGRFTIHRFTFDLLFDKETFTNRMLSSSYSLKPGDDDFDDYKNALHKLFDRYSSDGRVPMGNETVAYIGAL